MTETQATPACGETSARAHACAAAMVPGGVGPCIDAATNFENRADFGHPAVVAAKFCGSADLDLDRRSRSLNRSLLEPIEEVLSYNVHVHHLLPQVLRAALNWYNGAMEAQLLPCPPVLPGPASQCYHCQIC